jgi:hypothetical protein
MKHHLIASLAALLVTLLGASAEVQAAPLTYRDWSVTCNNIKTCMAYSVSSQSEGGLISRPRGLSEDVAQGWMTITRAAGPNAIPSILISKPDMSSDTLPPGTVLRLVTADGRTVAGGQFAVEMNSSDGIEIPASQNASFLRAARLATHAILVQGRNARPIFYFSLSGMVASGRAIDAHQGRTGTLDALIDVGRRPSNSVPSAPVRPVLYATAFARRPAVRPPASVMERRRLQCDDAERLDAGGTNITAYSLDRGRILWSVPCGAGAYNTWNQFYIQPARGPLVMAGFTGKPEGDSDEAIGLINASIDPAKGMITAFSKARGLGDCGSAETYIWNGETFALAELSEMVPCGGIISNFWPSVVTHTILPKTTR